MLTFTVYPVQSWFNKHGIMSGCTHTHTHTHTHRHTHTHTHTHTYTHRHTQTHTHTLPLGLIDPFYWVLT